jgi:hypothetical protein
LTGPQGFLLLTPKIVPQLKMHQREMDGFCLHPMAESSRPDARNDGSGSPTRTSAPTSRPDTSPRSSQTPGSPTSRPSPRPNLKVRGGWASTKSFRMVALCGNQSHGFVLAIKCKEFHINQKVRAEIVRRIEREETHGARLRKLGWEFEEERERTARDIKRSLFSRNLTNEGVTIT